MISYSAATGVEKDVLCRFFESKKSCCVCNGFLHKHAIMILYKLHTKLADQLEALAVG